VLSRKQAGPPKRHPHEDLIEKYILGNLAGAELVNLECHLTACRRCRDVHIQLATFIDTFRVSARKLEAATSNQRLSPSTATRAVCHPRREVAVAHAMG
jgi:hypothetical protein